MGFSVQESGCFKSCPREGASLYRSFPMPHLKVSSRAPVRGHRCRIGQCPAHPEVSSRAPVRGHPSTSIIGGRSQGFKSCPREGASLNLAPGFLSILIVSSRAPVRGHPKAAFITYQIHRVSSRAPVRGHPGAAGWRGPQPSVSSRAPVRGHLIWSGFRNLLDMFQVVPP